jgi:uncharacterized delta-60 repeat protein
MRNKRKIEAGILIFFFLITIFGCGRKENPITTSSSLPPNNPPTVEGKISSMPKSPKVSKGGGIKTGTILGAIVGIGAIAAAVGSAGGGGGGGGEKNHPPVISSIDVSPGTNVNTGASINLTCNASDSDGDTLTYTWTKTGGTLSTTTGQTVNWTAPSTEGTYRITVTVSDGKGGEVSASKDITVTATTNQNPVISSLTANPTSINTGQTSTITCTATDPDGDTPLTYTWTKTGGTITGSGSSVTYTAPNTAGTYTITVTVSDGKGGSATRSVDINVTQPSQEKWQKTYGGSSDDWANSIQQTSDGGYIVAGGTNSFGAGGGGDFYIIKLDASGNKVWEKTYGGSSSDWASSIQQTSDGGYIVAGETSSFGAGNGDFYIIKLDANGNKIWEKTYGGSSHDWASSIQQTSDGGYIVAGRTNSFGAGYDDFYIIKLDANGNKIWEKTYGGSSSDWAYSIQQTSDGGYIVAGETKSFGAGEYDCYIIKLDANGNKVWEKTYGGSSSDWANSIQQTTDGGYIVAGDTSSFGAGSYDFYIIKLDANGNTGAYPAKSKTSGVSKQREEPFDRFFHKQR